MSHPSEIEQPIAAPESASKSEIVATLVEQNRPTIVFTVAAESKETPSQSPSGDLASQPLPKSQVAPTPTAANEMVYDLTPEQSDLLRTLEYRLTHKPAHYQRPKGIPFAEVKAILVANPPLMATLSKMERSGGEPDIIDVAPEGFIFADCSARIPSGRRHLNYDQAVAMAKAFGAELMNEVAYRHMQRFGRFDAFNSWIWITTPDNIREDGHALHGYRSGSVIEIGRRAAKYKDEHGGWRGLLKVPRI